MKRTVPDRVALTGKRAAITVHITCLADKLSFTFVNVSGCPFI